MNIKQYLCAYFIAVCMKCKEIMERFPSRSKYSNRAVITLIEQLVQYSKFVVILTILPSTSHQVVVQNLSH